MKKPTNQTTTIEDVAGAQILLNDANHAVRVMEHERRAYVDKVKDAAVKVANDQWDCKNGTQTALLAATVDAARTFHRDCESAYVAALTDADLPYPRGTVMIEWRGRPWSRGYTRSERRGILAVWDHTSVRPANQGNWACPGLGDPYVRVLKKDGTESKIYDRLRRGQWHPEGFNPNDDLNQE